MQYKAARQREDRIRKNRPFSEAETFRRFRLLFAAAGIGTLFLLLLKNPGATADAAIDGLLLAARTVLPSTFPYMILSSLLLTCGAADAIGRLLGRVTKRLFFLPPVCAAVVLMGLVSGFPVGGSCAAELYLSGKCSREEAERILCFCNFCGPPFILSGVAGFLGSPRAGLAIFLAQTAVMLSLGILLGQRARSRAGKSAGDARCGAEKQTDPAVRRPAFPLLLYEAIKKACVSMLQIVGCIVFFSILSGLLEKISQTVLPASSGRKSLLLLFLRGFLEISGGTRAASAAGAAFGRPAAVFLCALATVWSGVSVHMQVASFALPAGLSMKRYYRCRIPAALSAALLSLLLAALFGAF